MGEKTEGERARGSERERGTGGRERARKGQTPQQQAWETSEASRDLENSHNRRALRRRQFSRDRVRAEPLFILWRWNTIPTCLTCNKL